MEVAEGAVADTVAGSVERTTVTKMAAVEEVDVADVEEEEGMVVIMEAMVVMAEVAEEVADGEAHQAAAEAVAVTIGGEINSKSFTQDEKRISNGFGLSQAPQEPNLTSSICVLILNPTTIY